MPHVTVRAPGHDRSISLGWMAVAWMEYFVVHGPGDVQGEPVRHGDEYTGFVLSRGIAAMAGISNLTVGIGVGWDNLTDRDRTIWIYQHKAWYGVTIGLNLN